MNKLHKHWLGLSLGVAAIAGVAAVPLSSHFAYGEDHMHNPHIHHAIEALHDAKDELMGASHDFHGKRKDAIDALDKAIDRLEEIKDYDH